jgi:hypothetical protein
MKILNRTWGILAKERASTNYSYYRKFSENIYSSNNELDRLLDIMVPYTLTDDYGRGHRIEALVQILMKSILRERTIDFEQIYTYEKSNMIYPEAGVQNNPFEISINLGKMDPNFGVLRIIGEANAGVVSYSDASDNAGTSNQNYVITNNLSSIIPLADNQTDFNFRFRIEPGGPFAFTLFGSPSVDYAGILEAMNAIDIASRFTDKELRDIYTKEDNWVDRLAACITHVVEGLAKPLSEED